MQKKYIMAISAVLMTVLIFCCTAAAYFTVDVRIDGKLRDFNPSAQVVNGRTMVPIRFIVEDEALQGQVNWDNKLQKITISCRGQAIELKVGSKKALADGVVKYLDVAPYVHNQRTFVPLRFISETLGATVNWDGEKQEVNIAFNQAIEPTPEPQVPQLPPQPVQKPQLPVAEQQPQRVFAYYYQKSPEFQENAHLFTDVAFRWFETDGTGRLFYEYQDDYDKVLALAREKGIKSHASVVLMGQEPLHQLLSNPKNRAMLEGNLCDEVQKKGYDGVNIDFEFISPKDTGLFNTFLKELKTMLGPDKTLSVAVFARTGYENWDTGYDYEQIGKIADLVVIMAYDYSYSTSSPGPVAPLWWVKDVVAYMVDTMPREKILLGLPTYGYNWVSGSKASTVTSRSLALIRQNYAVKEYFDLQQMSPSYTYTDSSYRTHQIWLENEKSLQEKWNVAVDNRLAGISFWRIGNGFTDLYQVLEKNQAGK